ncbi:hypothetical protein HI914_07120 [Erysiphe necator]|uniref:Histone deacetylase complex subunit SAP30 Sin3 binding domain-containing protein n=1 Tax=Uncinula necator TaxID=52586 RepID=A0A0B1PA90_UNCNE|nr:hypothetical protein HI914_07120 [Erysiphe necator]KHJ34240.1 hypothetical protein EV44_g1371 [Erysiphe necator]
MKEKSTSNNPSNSSGKGRRVAGLVAQSSSLKDVLRTSSCKKPTWPSNCAEDANSLQWSSFDSSILHAYRYDYRLDTPAAFKKPYNHIALSRSPIGKYSPTMAGRRDQKRQSKDQLADAVCNHFKCMGIVENDVVVEFLYKVHYQDKSFRMRFAPKR